MCSSERCIAGHTPDVTTSDDGVRITHPFHPARGQVIEVVRRARRWGDDVVLYRALPGHLGWMPTAWTSLADADPSLVGAQKAQFLVADLVKLVGLLSEVGR